MPTARTDGGRGAARAGGRAPPPATTVPSADSTSPPRPAAGATPTGPAAGQRTGCVPGVLTVPSPRSQMQPAALAATATSGTRPAGSQRAVAGPAASATHQPPPG